MFGGRVIFLTTESAEKDTEGTEDCRACYFFITAETWEVCRACYFFVTTESAEKGTELGVLSFLKRR